jgi:WD40 repeat protein
VADIRDMIFSPDGQELVLARGDVVEFYNLRDSAAVTKMLRGHQIRGVFGLTFSHDGQDLATTSSDGKVRVWRVSTGDVALSIPRDTASNVANNTAFLPDGTVLAVGDGVSIRRFVLSTGRNSSPLAPVTQRPSSLCRSLRMDSSLQGSSDFH